MEEVELATNGVPEQNPLPIMDQTASRKSSVSLFGLFSVADRVDYVLMFFGSVGSCVHGAAIPVFFVLFGRMIDSLGHLSTNPHRLSSRISEVHTRCDHLTFLPVSAFFLFFFWLMIYSLVRPFSRWS